MLTQAEQEELAALEALDGGGQPQGLTAEEAKELEMLEAMESGGEPSAALSGVRKLTQGLTGGFSDEIAGGTEALGQIFGVKGFGAGPIDQISLQTPNFDLEELKQAYYGARDQERSGLKLDSLVNPKISTTAEIGGAVVSPINKIAKGASLAKQAALIGGISGAGMSEAEDIQGLASDTAGGAVVGGVLGKGFDKAAPLIGKVTTPIADKIGAGAEWLAARSLGLERGTLKSLGAKKSKDVGRYALDNDIISPLASTDDMIARNEALKNKVMDARTDIYGAIDEAGASTFNPLDSAVKVEEKIGNFWRSPINKGETNQLENTLDSMLMRGDKNIPLKEAQKLKEELGKVANWKNKLNITDKEKMARDAYGVVATELEVAADVGAKKLNAGNLVEKLAEYNKGYSMGKGAEELLQNKQAREQGNKILGLTDSILLGGGATAGLMTGGASILPTLGILAAKKGTERYGAQNAALLLNKASKGVKGLPNAPKQMPLIYRELLQQNEE